MTLEILRWRLAKRVTQLGIVCIFLVVGGVVIAWPAMAAYVCPACYGLEPVTSDLLVESAMPAAERESLRETVLYARAACRVTRWLDANSGVAGLKLAMQATAQGSRSLP